MEKKLFFAGDSAGKNGGKMGCGEEGESKVGDSLFWILEGVYRVN